MKKILITGGCGFVGSNLAIYLKKKKFNVFSLDNLSRKGSVLNLERLKNFKIKNYKVDVVIEKNFKKLPKFDLIIDCCAEASVEFSRKNIDKVLATNLLGTYNILKKCNKDSSNLIFLSSSRVYSLESLKKLVNRDIIKNPLKINKEIDIDFDTDGPKTFYGFSKLSSEHLIKEYSFSKKIKYIINRCSVIAGPWQFGKVDQGFVSLWVWRCLNKIPVRYFGYGGYGNQLRDILSVNDLCDLVYIQIKKFRKINNLTLSIGGGKKNSISLNTLTNICQKIIKNKINIELKKNNYTSDYDIPYFVSSLNRVKKLYNWKPKENINKIINEIYKWQKINLNILKKYF